MMIEISCKKHDKKLCELCNNTNLKFLPKMTNDFFATLACFCSVHSCEKLYSISTRGEDDENRRRRRKNAIFLSCYVMIHFQHGR